MLKLIICPECILSQHKIGARIADLWRFKARKVKKLQEDRLAIFKPGLRQTGFFFFFVEWYHHQQELMVSNMIVKLFINSFTMGSVACV